ncbi:MAG TPA: UMP kinase [Methanospirillum sp.]|uniref:UMP kinase n=1 Tax=Methanospirillum sp. TaxID=45200 RepID=UPI002CFDC23E|nr:UMP kinase [Methanospirillum sp.]HOJ96535.1 UMP kinase [Methanospirillum sp.]HPP77599.1 UMP kinase [Methanospirillum sp.]
MPTIVLSLGGSVLLPDIDRPNIKPYISVLTRISVHHRLFVVVGGGGTARQYIALARSFEADEAFSDELGIMVTRLNAMLLVGALGEAAYPAVVTNHTEALCAAESGKIVVMGGITPGQTTDAVAAVLAERVQADLFINLTAVDGIYSADPRKDPSASRFDTMTPAELLSVVIGQQAVAGVNTVMDIVAVKMVERCGIPLLVMDGRDPALLETTLETGRFVGTLVTRQGKNPFPLKK